MRGKNSQPLASADGEARNVVKVENIRFLNSISEATQTRAKDDKDLNGFSTPHRSIVTFGRYLVFSRMKSAIRFASS
jgi:hypothetical protein